MAFFSYNGIEGDINFSGYGTYQITAENEFGDTIRLTTHNSEMYDLIHSDPDFLTEEDLEKRDNAIQALCEKLADDEDWQRKASVKCFPTNAIVSVGAAGSLNIDYDFQDPEFFDSEDDLKEWVDDKLNDLLWEGGNIKLLNYNKVVKDLCDFLCSRYVKY